jgi:23S rRNA pseudouridine2605 synthase
VSVRLQKFLAEAGIGSRRACEDLVQEGRVKVDGKVVTLGSSVDPDTQRVEVDDRLVAVEAKEYWLLNKPEGVLSAAVDSRGRPTVVDYVPARVRVFPVGRLDLNSTGLMLLTNDGDLASRLLHPRYHVEKEYTVRVRGSVSAEALARLRGGLILDDGPTAPAGVAMSRSAGGSAAGGTTLQVTLREGRKRQVRRMMEAIGHRVVSLHRRRFDGLTDDGLARGEARPLSQDEVQCLREQAGLDPR